jgi:hypothetical protein
MPTLSGEGGIAAQRGQYLVLFSPHPPLLARGTIIISAQVQHPMNDVAEQFFGLVDPQPARLAAGSLGRYDDLSLDFRLIRIVAKIERQHVGRGGIAHVLLVERGHGGIADDGYVDGLEGCITQRSFHCTANARRVRCNGSGDSLDADASDVLPLRL